MKWLTDIDINQSTAHGWNANKTNDR